MDDIYSIKLPLFEGPLDLLLHLIRDQKIDIYDIPISLITRQYLEYIEIMKELNLEIAGEFLVMAATLIHIKSRMLLPVEETADTEEPEDPRLELVMKLLEYQAYKDAALELKEREEEWSHVFSREGFDEESAEDDEEEPVLFDLNMFDLISTFQKILEKAPEEVRTLTKETLTIKDKMNIIIEALQSREALRFTDLFKGDIIRAHFIVTFIAFLELVRLGLARVYQEKQFGTIWVISPESEKDFSFGYRPPLVEGIDDIEEGWRKERTKKPLPAAKDKLPWKNPFPEGIGTASSISGLPFRSSKVPSQARLSFSSSIYHRASRPSVGETEYTTALPDNLSSQASIAPPSPALPVKTSVPSETLSTSDGKKDPFMRYVSGTGNALPQRPSLPSRFGESVSELLPSFRFGIPGRTRTF